MLTWVHPIIPAELHIRAAWLSYYRIPKKFTELKAVFVFHFMAHYRATRSDLIVINCGHKGMKIISSIIEIGCKIITRIDYC